MCDLMGHKDSHQESQIQSSGAGARWGAEMGALGNAWEADGSGDGMDTESKVTSQPNPPVPTCRTASGAVGQCWREGHLHTSSRAFAHFIYTESRAGPGIF